MSFYDVEVTVVTTGNVVHKATLRRIAGNNPRQAKEAAIMVDEQLGTRVPEHLAASVSALIVDYPEHHDYYYRFPR